MYIRENEIIANTKLYSFFKYKNTYKHKYFQLCTNKLLI